MNISYLRSHTISRSLFEGYSNDFNHVDYFAQKVKILLVSSLSYRSVRSDDPLYVKQVISFRANLRLTYKAKKGAKQSTFQTETAKMMRLRIKRKCLSLECVWLAACPNAWSVSYTISPVTNKQLFIIQIYQKGRQKKL